MSKRGQQGKAEWADRAGTYGEELDEQISTDATRQMDRWKRQGRIPAWARFLARIRGHRLELPGTGQPR
ncbi:MAG: hypothetical protein ACRDOB_08580 [Streptosporangiaceae bacterium]